jgi:aconitate hydratase
MNKRLDSERNLSARGKSSDRESFERIHRSNLVGMGVLPLQFIEGQNASSLGIIGNETFERIGLCNTIRLGQMIKVKVIRVDSSSFEFEVIVRLDNVVDINYYYNGGIMQTVLRQLIEKSRSLGSLS